MIRATCVFCFSVVFLLLFVIVPVHAVTITPLTSNSGHDSQPNWSHDGTRIVFLSERSGQYGMWIMPASGGAPNLLMPSSGSGVWGDFGEQEAEWSPGDNTIVFQSTAHSYWDIYKIPASGGSPIRLTYMTDCVGPSYSPDGSTIVFRHLSGGYHLWTVPASGGTPVKLTSGSSEETFPEYSPDGSKIVFQYLPGVAGSRDVYVIPAPGGSLTPLATDPSDDGVNPSWSPDGKYIAFSSDRGGNRNIWVMDSRGETYGLWQITTHPTADEWPSWAPDSKRIVFHSDRSGNRDLWIASELPMTAPFPETYEFVTMWGSCGSGDYQFGVDLGPRGLAVDNAGNLYVADYGNRKIKTFSTSGTFKYSFSPGYVSDIAYANGYLYFTKPYGYACKYTVTGTKVWEKYFSAPGWNLNGICVDSDGNIHVCNSYYNKVYKLGSGTGNLIKEYSVPEGCWQIASDNNGHVYIASGSGPVQRYTNDGVYDNSILNLPPEERVGNIDVDDQGNIFIGTANYKMRKYDSNWNLLSEWGEQGSGQGQFSGIGGVAIDNQGYVYVSDGGGASCAGMNRRIQVFRPSGAPPATGQIMGSVFGIDERGVPVSLSGAEVVISGVPGTFTAYTDGMGEYFKQLPIGTYSVTASKAGYMSETKTGQIVEENTTTWVPDFKLDPWTASLLARNPDDGDILDSPSGYIRLRFNKDIDISSLEQNITVCLQNEGLCIPNALTQIEVTRDPMGTYIAGVKTMGQSTPFWYGYDNELTVTIHREALDTDGHQLGQDYIWSFYTKSEFLEEVTYMGHSLKGQQGIVPVEYSVKLKGKDDPLLGEVVNYELYINCEGVFAEKVSDPTRTYCKAGEPTFMKGILGGIKLKYLDAAVSLAGQVQVELHEYKTTPDEGHWVKMAEYNEIWLKELLDEPPFILAQDFIPLAVDHFSKGKAGIPFLGTTLYFLKQQFRIAGIPYDVRLDGVSSYFEEFAMDINNFDVLDIPLYFKYYEVDLRKVDSIKITLPLEFRSDSHLELLPYFKSFIVFDPFYVGEGYVDNLYTSLPSDAYPASNGQFQYLFDLDIDVGREPPQLPALTGDVLEADESQLGTVETFDKFIAELRVGGCEAVGLPIWSMPILIYVDILGPSINQINTTSLYKIVIECEKGFSLDGMSGYIFLLYNDVEVSLGDIADGYLYGDGGDVLVQGFAEDGTTEVTLFQETDPWGWFSDENVYYVFLVDAIQIAFPPVGFLTALYHVMSIIGDLRNEGYKLVNIEGMPPLFDNDNSYDIPKAAINFRTHSNNEVHKIVVTFPLAFHELPTDLKLYVTFRPFKEKFGVRDPLKPGWEACMIYIMDPSVEQYEKEFPLPIGYAHPALIVEARSPVDLLITDPENRQTSKEVSDIPNSFYEEDVDSFGTTDILRIVDPIPGIYNIKVIPEPNSNSSNVYSLIASYKGISQILAQRDSIGNIPPEGYNFNILPCAKICGNVFDYPEGVLGVTIDLLDSANSLLQSVCTDDSGFYSFDSLEGGDYVLSMNTPLGYSASSETKHVHVSSGIENISNFYISKSDLAQDQRSAGYWKHQVNVHLSGKGNAQESLEDMSAYMNLISIHFNNNLANPITIFEVPQPATQTDSLEVLQGLLTVNKNGTMNDRAKQQLIALMLNVVSLKLHQITPISEDSATASQAITYCNQLITDSDSSNDEIAEDIADQINNGIVVTSGVIPLSTPNISYKGAEEEIAETPNLPSEFSLSQNYPNPFNPVCNIEYAIPTDCKVGLSIYNILGQKVRVLVDEYQGPAYRSVRWDGKDDQGQDVASGVYLYRIQAGDFGEAKKMLLLK